MQLHSISVKNFRSIEEVKFDINKIDNDFTFTLIGINESGKSSFLKGISLFDEENAGIKLSTRLLR
jgi:predicted ATP-dependent endonuclease of OLD family